MMVPLRVIQKSTGGEREMQNRSVRSAVSVAALIAGVSLCLRPMPAHAGVVSVTVDPSNWQANTSAGISEDPLIQDNTGPPGSLPDIINNPGNSGASAGVTITGFPGIAVSASSANNTTFGSASGSLTFYFELVANADYGGSATGIPILLDGKSSQSLKGSAGSDSTSVGMTIEVVNGAQGSSFDLDTSNNGVFTGNFDIASGVEYEIDMSASVSAHGASSAGASIDPMLTVNPNFFEANDLNFVFSDGISNGVSSTPLPAALPLFAGGLGVIGLFGRRRNRKNASAIAAA
jgi:hypothetical protein